MAQALFINRTDLVRNSILDGNVDSTTQTRMMILTQVKMQFLMVGYYEI